jgi:hypothetical protein
MTTRRLRVLVCVACLLPLDLVVGVALLGTHALGSVLVRLFPKSRIPPMSPPRTDSVTVQILSWDGQHLLEEFLPSVLAGAGRHEVVVVDNGSTDSSVQFLKTQYPGIRVVQLDRNYGFSDGNNRGMKQVATDIVVLLNNDMAVDAHFLAPLLKPFADPAVFAVASQITMADPMKASFETGKTRGRFESGLFYVWHDEVSTEDDKRESVPVFWAGAGACAICSADLICFITLSMWKIRISPIRPGSGVGKPCWLLPAA